MRVTALSIVALLGCARGGDVSKAEPANDAQAEVPRIDAVVSEDADPDADANADADADALVVDTSVADTSVADTSPADTSAADTSAADTTAGPWSHTIPIDGTNEFYADLEKIPTTTVGYDAFVTWDATNLYFAMSGADIGATASATKWVFLYIDVDPGASTGSLTSERYNTQQSKLPTGFGAEYYLRWKTDNSFATLEKWDFPTKKWTTHTATVDRARTANFVEFRVARATFASTTIGLASFMVNEQPTLESTFAGLYAGTFTDGYSALGSITKYLHADMLAPATPNAASRMKP